MRQEFAKLLFAEMERNPALVLITTDLGFGLWDAVRTRHPTRFINTGAAEQAAAGIGIGLALSGQIPILYSITPFLLCRPYEFWRNYLNHERVPVKLVGSGRGKDYATNGFSHWAEDDKNLLGLWPEISGFWPENDHELRQIFHQFLSPAVPSYLNLKR